MINGRVIYLALLLPILEKVEKISKVIFTFRISGRIKYPSLCFWKFKQYFSKVGHSKLGFSLKVINLQQKT